MPPEPFDATKQTTFTQTESNAMYCPNCAATIDGLKFCRACGTDVRLVPEAMTGKLEERAVGHDATGHPIDRHGRRLRDKPASMSSGIQMSFMGVGFLLVSFAASFWGPAGHIWWFWLLIPAFSMLGKGIAEIVRARQEEKKQLQQTMTSPSLQPASLSYIAPPTINTNELPPAQPASLNTPSSITEGTTRHLDPRIEQPNR